MQSPENRKRAPAWTTEELLDLIAIWGEDSVLTELRSSKRNEKVFERISKSMIAKGYSRDSFQCRIKVKELRQAYQKTREGNGRSGVAPKTCRFYAELHAIFGGLATSRPSLIVDSDDLISVSTVAEDSAEGEDQEEGHEGDIADTTQLSITNSSQELFLTQDLTLQQANQATITESEAMEGTSAVQCSLLTTPSARLPKRQRKKRTRDEMFSEVMEVSHSNTAHHSDLKELIAKYKKDASDREDRRDARDERWREEDRQVEERWRKEDRQEDQRCREEDRRWRDGTLELLRDHTDILRRMLIVQEQQRGYRVPLQSMFNHPPSSPGSISPSRRRVRTRGGRLPAPAHSTPMESPTKRL
ncbi:uncharacterized protein LOC142047372 [Chelonoidis abingdonii]|uniref:uncharacterized protein LOC142046272 n=1 Tax=Chelonoidis abingdonii TaxID=106734 RepID=UPI003F49A1D0